MAILWFIVDCLIWLKSRTAPDKRPTLEVTAEVRQRLQHYPADAGIHRIFTALDKVDEIERKREVPDADRD